MRHPFMCLGSDLSADLGTSFGKQFSASGAAHTKSGYTQLIASTPYDFDYLMIGSVLRDNSGASTWAFDIAIGGAGSELILVPDLVLSTDSRWSQKRVGLPLKIPAGSRISARFQSTATGGTSFIDVQGFTCSGLPHVSGFDALGFTAASTTGAVMPYAGSQNTKGSYIQVIASTTRDYKGFFAAFDNNPANHNGGVFMLADIAIGAAASEIVLVPNIALRVGDVEPQHLPFLPIHIPAGTRIAARSQQENTNSQGSGIVIYGGY